MSAVAKDRFSPAVRVALTLGEIVGWAMLVGLSLLSLNGLVLLYAFMALLVPGLILMAMPNLLMVLVLVQPARFIWRFSRIAAVVAAVAGLSMLLVIPAVTNAPLERAAAAERAGDFAAGALPAARSVLLLKPRDVDCDGDCRRLLEAGVPEVTVGLMTSGWDPARGYQGEAASYRIGDEEGCRGCLVRTDTLGGRADLVLDVQSHQTGAEQRGGDAARRYNPFLLGRVGVVRTQAWDCRRDANCRLIQRSTHVRYAPLKRILFLGMDSSSYELRFIRGWERESRSIGEEDTAAMAGRLLGLDIPERAIHREIQPSLEGTRRELALAAVQNRKPAVPLLGALLSGWTDPLTPDQIDFIRELVRHPTLETLPLEWSAHPGLAARLAPDLARALNTPADRPRFRVSLHKGLATAPKSVLIDQKAAILRWLQALPADYVRFERQTSNAFVLRLADLGPDMARVAARRATTTGRWPETATMSRTLCRMGPQARPALAALKQRQAAMADRGETPDTTLDRTIDAIEGDTAAIAICRDED